jgi:hypothetical protein
MRKFSTLFPVSLNEAIPLFKLINLLFIIDGFKSRRPYISKETPLLLFVLSVDENVLSVIEIPPIHLLSG